VGAFHLSKWYLDCVSEEGTAVVGYFARLRWRSLGLEYAAALVAPEDGAPRQVHALRSLRPPALSGGVCTWRCEAVGVQAEWRALDAPVRRELLRTPAGSIRWTLHQPRSEAHIRLAGDLLPGPGEIRGLGYVEELELTMPPWQLPFDVLLWGRFLSATDALVWIRWEKGENPAATRRQFVLLNGVPVDGAVVEPDRVLVAAAGASFGAGPGHGGTPSAELRLSAGRPLREGPLAASVFSAVPGLVSLLPRRFRDAHESKRLTRGLFGASAGWAIHEVVRW